MHSFKLLIMFSFFLLLTPSAAVCKEYLPNLIHASRSNQNLSSLKGTVQDWKEKNGRLMQENQDLKGKIRSRREALGLQSGKKIKTTDLNARNEMDDHRAAKEIFFAEKELARLNDDLSKINEELNNLQQEFNVRSEEMGGMEKKSPGESLEISVVSGAFLPGENEQKRIEFLEDHYKKLYKKYTGAKALLDKLTTQRNVMKKEKEQLQSDYEEALKEEEKIKDPNRRGAFREGELDERIRALKSHASDLEGLLVQARKKAGRSSSDMVRRAEAEKEDLERNIEVLKSENFNLKRRMTSR